VRLERAGRGGEEAKREGGEGEPALRGIRISRMTSGFLETGVCAIHESCPNMLGSMCGREKTEEGGGREGGREAPRFVPGPVCGERGEVIYREEMVACSEIKKKEQPKGRCYGGSHEHGGPECPRFFRAIFTPCPRSSRLIGRV
jgi:hypothetical protein